MGSLSCRLRGLPVLQQHFQGLQMVFPFRLSQKARSNPHLCALSGYKEARKAYMIHLGRIMDLAKAGKDKEAWAILWSDDYNATVNIGLQSIDRMEELKVAQAKEAIVSNEALANASTWQMIVA